MLNNIKIAPSILSADFSKMGEEVKKLELNGADLIHCDVMDGVFVKNISFGAKMIKDIKKHTKLILDAHLMIVNPERYISNFADNGADIITVHEEACGDNLLNVLKDIKKLNVKCGAVINPDTSVEKIKNVIEYCDMVLIMSVFPGFGGQKFITSALDKILQVREYIEKIGKNIDVEIDGGINLLNVGLVKKAGANVIVAGSTIFNSENQAKTILALKNN